MYIYFINYASEILCTSLIFTIYLGNAILKMRYSMYLHVCHSLPNKSKRSPSVRTWLSVVSYLAVSQNDMIPYRE